jgi:hypothetical protein
MLAALKSCMLLLARIKNLKCKVIGFLGSSVLEEHFLSTFSGCISWYSSKMLNEACTFDHVGNVFHL